MSSQPYSEILRAKLATVLHNSHYSYIASVIESRRDDIPTLNMCYTLFVKALLVLKNDARAFGILVSHLFTQAASFSPQPYAHIKSLAKNLKADFSAPRAPQSSSMIMNTENTMNTVSNSKPGDTVMEDAFDVEEEKVGQDLNDNHFQHEEEEKKKQLRAFEEDGDDEPS